METRLDRFGRIVLPKDVRDLFALVPGDLLEVRETVEGILLTRLAAPGEADPLRTADGVLVYGGEASEEVAGAVGRDRQARLEKVTGRLGKRQRAGRRANR